MPPGKAWGRQKPRTPAPYPATPPASVTYPEKVAQPAPVYTPAIPPAYQQGGGYAPPSESYPQDPYAVAPSENFAPSEEYATESFSPDINAEESYSEDAYNEEAFSPNITEEESYEEESYEEEYPSGGEQDFTPSEDGDAWISENDGGEAFAGAPKVRTK